MSDFSSCTSFVMVTDGDSFVMEDNGETFAMIGNGTTDYTTLNNKPSINGVELVGNKTTEELGITLDVSFVGTTLVINT